MIIAKRWDDNKNDTDVLRLATADEIKRLSNINDHVVERAVVARWAKANGGVIVGYHDGKYDIFVGAIEDNQAVMGVESMSEPEEQK